MNFVKLFLIVLLVISASIFIIPPELGGFLKLYYVSSSSMEPNIPIGSLLVASPPTFITSINVGDVVVYMDRDLGRLVSHRVIGVCEGGYVIKADVGGSGTCVPRRDVVAKSIVALPFIGWLGIMSNTAPIIILILVLFMVPSKDGSFYPISSILSLLPLLLPLREGFPRLLGPYTGIMLTVFFASGSIILRLAERERLMKGLVDLTYILLSIASLMVVEIPWLK